MAAVARRSTSRRGLLADARDRPLRRRHRPRTVGTVHQFLLGPPVRSGRCGHARRRGTAVARDCGRRGRSHLFRPGLHRPQPIVRHRVGGDRAGSRASRAHSSLDRGGRGVHGAAALGARTKAGDVSHAGHADVRQASAVRRFGDARRAFTAGQSVVRRQPVACGGCRRPAVLHRVVRGGRVRTSTVFIAGG